METETQTLEEKIFTALIKQMSNEDCIEVLSGINDEKINCIMLELLRKYADVSVPREHRKIAKKSLSKIRLPDKDKISAANCFLNSLYDLGINDLTKKIITAVKMSALDEMCYVRDSELHEIFDAFKTDQSQFNTPRYRLAFLSAQERIRTLMPLYFYNGYYENIDATYTPELYALLKKEIEWSVNRSRMEAEGERLRKQRIAEMSAEKEEIAGENKDSIAPANGQSASEIPRVSFKEPTYNTRPAVTRRKRKRLQPDDNEETAAPNVPLRDCLHNYSGKIVVIVGAHKKFGLVRNSLEDLKRLEEEFGINYKYIPANCDSPLHDLPEGDMYIVVVPGQIKQTVQNRVSGKPVIVYSQRRHQNIESLLISYSERVVSE